MNFTDTIKVQALVYEDAYATIGGNLYHIKDGEIGEAATDDEKEQFANGSYDDEGNEIEPVAKWLVFGKEKNAIIFPNSRANKVSLNDGRDFVYSYEVIVKLKKSLYSILPKEGDRVWLHKADGTIEKDMEVKGFATLKQRYLKLWL